MSEHVCSTETPLLPRGAARGVRVARDAARDSASARRRPARTCSQARHARHKLGKLGRGCTRRRPTACPTTSSNRFTAKWKIRSCSSSGRQGKEAVCMRRHGGADERRRRRQRRPYGSVGSIQPAATAAAAAAAASRRREKRVSFFVDPVSSIFVCFMYIFFTF